MAKYDPKRPRQLVEGDEVSQVDAILGDVATETAVADLTGSIPTETATGSDGAAVEDAGTVTSGPGGTDPQEARRGEGPADVRVPVDRITGGSDVPVVTPPAGGTVNRAVLGAVVATLATVLVVILVMRRRRRP